MGSAVSNGLTLWENYANAEDEGRSDLYAAGVVGGTIVAIALAPLLAPLAAEIIASVLADQLGLFLLPSAIADIATVLKIAAPIAGLATLPKLFGNSLTAFDPLAIDLTGSGLNLTSLSNSSTTFDYADSGLSNPTGWIGSGTALLVMPNAEGQVNEGSELFGPSTGNGFTELAALDSNHDGVINSKDAAWSQLRIWQDTNEDGVAEPGELETLAQAGIQSISLNATSVNEAINGNIITETATVTFANGKTSTISEVQFAVNSTDTVLDPSQTPAGEYTLTTQIEALPNLKGYGQVYDLQIAMCNDTQLVADVTTLTNVALGDFTDFSSDLTAALYEWTGVTNVNPASRGGYMDARQLEALENITGISWLHYGSINPGPYHPSVTAAWNNLLDSEELSVAVQTDFSAYFPDLFYDSAADTVLGVLDVAQAEASQPSNLTQFSSSVGELGGFQAWFKFLSMAEADSTYLTELGGSATYLSAEAIVGLFGGMLVGTGNTSGTLSGFGYDYAIFADNFSGNIVSQSGEEVIDTGTGQTNLSLSDGDKQIFTRTGTSTINLEGNENTVTTGTGTTYVTTPSGSDTIHSGSALTTYVRAYGGVLALGSLSLDTDGSLSYANAGYTGTLTLYNDMQFAPTSYGGYDNLVFMPSTQTSFSIAALPGGDAATIFVDEAGNDTLTFANGQTTIWVANDGTDAATLSSGTTDIQFAGPSTDYTIAYDGHGVLTVTNMADENGNGTKTLTLAGGNGELWFADGVKVGFGNSVSTISPDATQYGGSGNDAFYVDGGASTINGGGGTNTVYFDMNPVAPDGRLAVGETASGAVTINGAADGYNGTATLTNIQTVYFGNNYYTLFATPSGGGSVTNASSSTYN